MRRYFFLVFVGMFLSTIRRSITADLPSYIKACSLSDPKYKQCLIESAQDAIPQMRKGDSTYKIPSIAPLKIPLVEVNMGDDLKVKFTNVIGYHLFEDIKIKDLEFEPAKGVFKLLMYTSGFTVDADYSMNMKLMGLPIAGNGPTKVNVTGMDLIYEAKLKTVKKNGAEHLDVESAKGSFTLEGAWFHFDNLFNGDQRLGDATNKLINENWKDFTDLLKPAVNEIIHGLFKSYLKGIFDAVPKDSVVLP